ncbi:MAG: hypothetical protein M1816_001216 [Peltula sp. TS41687]|nr:MAG: hypothetical protein M1816_001216 [Peltula sp. TS41687]
MPSLTRPRHVGFEPTPSVSRQPTHDEYEAMYRFARHASKCEQCFDPYSAHRKGQTLCNHGHHHARAVAKFLFSKDGRPVSTTDGNGYQFIQVEIPHGYEAVRALLRAIESGLRLRKARSPATAPVVSYDPTYYVPARRTSTGPRQDHSRIDIVEPPRGHHGDGKVVYINYDGSPSYQPSTFQEDGMIISAAPQSRSRRVRFAEEQFYP